MLLLVSLGWLSFPATVPSAPSGSGQGSMVFLPQEPASPSGEPEPAVLVRHPAPPPERASASTPSNEIEITGTVVIESADGAECLPSSATLTLQLWPGPASQDAAVAAGAWRIRVPEHTRWLLIQRLIVDGRSAGVDDHKLEVDERRHFAIRARWLSPMRLRVIDAKTRTDLAGLTIVRRPVPYHSSTLVHPGSYTSADVMWTDVTSPVVLQPPSTDLPELWFVHAAGYAWGRLEVNRTSDGDRVLALGRGGTVEIQVANMERLDRSWSGTRLRVHGQREVDNSIALQALRAMASADPELRQLFGTEDELRAMLQSRAEDSEDDVLVDVAPDASGVTTIEDLSPGPCEVKLVLEDLVLASATADLRADQMAAVTLHPIQLPRPLPPVPLAGSIHVPLAWRVARLRLNGGLLDRLDVSSEERGRSSGILTPDPRFPDVFPFDLGPVLPGRWRLSLWGFGVAETVTVPPDGRADVQIRIAEPADVRVTVLDASTGGLIDIDGVHWLVATNETSQDFARWEMSQRAEFFWTFRAPAGDVLLRVADHPYFHTERVRLGPGVNSITLRVGKVCGVRLSLTYGSSVVPFPEGEIELRDAGSERVTRHERAGAMVAEVYVPGPGRYLLTLPPIPGFASVPPFELNVPAGELVEHAVTLEKR